MVEALQRTSKTTYRTITSPQTPEEITRNQKIDLIVYQRAANKCTWPHDTHLQPSLSARTPPNTGPSEGPTMGPMFQMPKKLPRSAGAAMSAMTPAPANAKSVP